MSGAAPAAAPVLPAAGRGWTPALLLLGAGLVVLGAAFWREAAAAVRVWDSSAAYNHCWLVLPIAAWLAWTRRHRLAGLAPQPSPLLALLALPVALAWLAAERLGVMEGRQLTALALVLVLVLAVLGWRIWRALAAPLLYLVFLVPFGAWTTPALQSATARMIDILLDATSIPHYVDDLIIETPAGLFLVAEACAGLRFLIAALAFGALYAVVMFRSPGRRLAVMALALVVPILANGVRAFGIVLLGHYLGSAEAAAADHVIYGWAFFSLVMLLLILAGLPFREDGAPEAPRMPPATASEPRGRAVLAGAAALSLGLAAAAPAASLAIQGTAGAPERRAIPLRPLEGCEAAPGGAALRCGELRITAEAVVFSAAVTWSAVSAERGRLAGHDDQDLLFGVPLPGGGTWRARQSRDTGTAVVVAPWLNGRPAGSGLRSRAEQALNSLGAGRGAPVLLVVRLQPEPGATAAGGSRQRALLQDLAAAQGPALMAPAAEWSRRR